MKQMQCDDVALWFERFIDGELTPDMQSTLEAHIEGCPDCQQRVRAFQEVDELGRMDFFADPGDEYWVSLTSRIMRELPEPRASERPVWDAVKAWFGSPAFGRRFAFAAVLAAVLFAGVRYSGITFRDDRPMEIALEREATLSSGATGTIIREGVSDPAAVPRVEGEAKPSEETSDAGIRRASGATEREAAGTATEVPYVPRQMTVTPKPPTAENNSPAVENPLLNREAGPEDEIPAAGAGESEKEDLAVSDGLQSSPSVRTPRIPQQGVSALDARPAPGVSAYQYMRPNTRSSKSSTRLSDLNSTIRANNQGVGSSNLSDSDLLQNKIILLEVLQTGKDRKIMDVALLQLDGIYQEMLSRDAFSGMAREIKGFYSVYERELIGLLGRDEYDARLAQVK